MKTSILLAVACALSSVACDISCFGECDDWDEECSEPRHDDGGGKHSGGPGPGQNASGGTAAGGSGSGGSAHTGDSGGTANAAGKSGNSDPVSCAEERDCPRGFNCDYESKECVAADAETCPELTTESACDNRKDCMSVYAGINCSCGANCECVGGEPGCVCQSFEFFTCEALKN